MTARRSTSMRNKGRGAGKKQQFHKAVGFFFLWAKILVLKIVQNYTPPLSFYTLLLTEGKEGSKQRAAHNPCSSTKLLEKTPLLTTRGQDTPKNRVLDAVCPQQPNPVPSFYSPTTTTAFQPAHAARPEAVSRAGRRARRGPASRRPPQPPAQGAQAGVGLPAAGEAAPPPLPPGSLSLPQQQDRTHALPKGPSPSRHGEGVPPTAPAAQTGTPLSAALLRRDDTLPHRPHT